MDRLSKIYVAGHQGLVGSALLRSLKSKGYGNLIYRTRSELDLMDQNAVAEFFQAQKPECVFLAAARVGGIQANSTYRAEFIYNNLMIQTNVLHQAYLHKTRRLVFLGSSCIYPKLAPQPIKEEHLLSGPLEETNSPYAVAKIAGIEMCRAYNSQYGTSFVPLMPTNIFGPHDNFDLESSHVLPAMLRKFHLGKLAGQGNWQAIARDEERHGKIPPDIMQALRDPDGAGVVLWGSGRPLREFIEVDEMADACVFVGLETKTTDLVNIGTGKDVSIKDLAGMIAKVVGYSGQVVWDSDKPDGTPRKLLDTTRLAGLGWKPRHTFIQGLCKTYDWYCGLDG
jgi:GDP-L-fucose synthase